MAHCAAYGCHNDGKKHKHVSYHKLPPAVELAKEWRKNSGLAKFPKQCYFCSDHFEDHCFDKSFERQQLTLNGAVTARKVLKNAIPTIFPHKSRSKSRSSSTVRAARKESQQHILSLPVLADRQVTKPTLHVKTASPSKPASKRESKNKVKNKDLPVSGGIPSPDITENIPKFNFDKFSTFLQEIFIPSVHGGELSNMKEFDAKLNELVVDTITKFNADDIQSQISTEDSMKNNENDDAETIATKKDEEAGNQNPVEAPKSDGAPGTNYVETPAIKDEEQYTSELKLSCFFTSLLCSITQAKCTNQSWFTAISKQLDSDRFTLPVPAVACFKCDKSTQGRLNAFKEVLILPKATLTPYESTKNLITFMNVLEEYLITKYGAIGSARNTAGILTPPFEKPEQLFEALTHTATNAGYELSEKFDLILHMENEQIFDEEKTKYEILSGLFKTSDDMIQLFTHWLESYPILAFIDPFSKKDIDGRLALFSSLSSRCYIMLDCCNTTADEMLDNTHEQATLINSLMCSPYHLCTTVADVMNISKQLEDLKLNHMVTEKYSNSFNVEVLLQLAIAMNAQFLWINPLSFGGLAMLEKLLVFEQELQREGLLGERTPYIFTEQKEVVHSDENEEEVNTENCENAESTAER